MQGPLCQMAGKFMSRVPEGEVQVYAAGSVEVDGKEFEVLKSFCYLGIEVEVGEGRRVMCWPGFGVPGRGGGN